MGEGYAIDLQDFSTWYNDVGKADVRKTWSIPPDPARGNGLMGGQNKMTG
jgi:hypothetical protein